MEQQNPLSNRVATPVPPAEVLSHPGSINSGSKHSHRPRIHIVHDAGRFWAVKSIAGAATASDTRLEKE